MTLVRWRPTTDLFSIQNEIDRVFDSVLRSAPATRERGWQPSVDLRETEEAFILVAELPGVSKDDVRISLTDNMLSLRGEKKTEVRNEKDQWHHVERTYGSFERHVQLTTPVESDKIKAAYKDGILTVTLPKAMEARPREIQIDF